jgi:hypothetical protein
MRLRLSIVSLLAVLAVLVAPGFARAAGPMFVGAVENASPPSGRPGARH